jgi:hypothetical protein
LKEKDKLKGFQIPFMSKTILDLHHGKENSKIECHLQVASIAMQKYFELLSFESLFKNKFKNYFKIRHPNIM